MGEPISSDVLDDEQDAPDGIVCRPARERVHARCSARFVPDLVEIVLPEEVVRRSSTYRTERWTHRTGRIVADTVPASATISCRVATLNSGQNHMVWNPADYPFGSDIRFVAGRRNVVETGGYVAEWAPLPEAALAGSMRIGIGSQLLRSDASVPEFYYRRRGGWVWTDAVVLGNGALAEFSLPEAESAAVLLVGTFSRTSGQHEMLVELASGTGNSAQVYLGPQDSLVLQNVDGETASLPGIFSPGLLVGILLHRSGSEAGITAITDTSIRSASLAGFAEGSTGGSVMVYGHAQGVELVEADAWSGGVSVQHLKSEVSALLSYYATRQP